MPAEAAEKEEQCGDLAGLGHSGRGDISDLNGVDQWEVGAEAIEVE